MPPPQHLLASRIRGFVCRSCLSKLQTPQRQRAPWIATRNITTTGAGAKGAAKDADQSQADEAEPAIQVKYWEQDLEGNRKEIFEEKEDAEERELKASIQQEVKDLEQKEGRPLEEVYKDIMGSEDDIRLEMGKRMGELVEEGYGDAAVEGPSDEDLAMLESKSEEIEAHNDIIERYGGIDNIDNLSEEERLQLREDLLPSIREATERAGPSRVDSTSAPPNAHKIDDTSRPLKVAKEPRTPAILAQSDGAFLIPIEAFPQHAQSRLIQLNHALFPSSKPVAKSRTRRKRGPPAKSPDVGHDLQEIWRAYILCRTTLVSHAELVPHRTWHALWNRLSEEGPHNLDRMGHIKYLGEDMRKANVPLHPREHLLLIEALFIDDDRNMAYKEWEDMQQYAADRLGYHLDATHHHTDKRWFQTAYWELGIRMYSLDGKPEQGFEAAVALFKITRDPAAYRALLPIMSTFLAENSCQRAWGLYVEMRLRLGSRITMEDYDNIISIFFEANQPYLALGVFKDMMLTGDESLADRDSVAPYRDGAGTAAPLSIVAVTERDWQGPELLASLPARFNNKFFFGKWIKKLIGEGELDLAKKVFDLMQDRGIIPSPVHLNGLIGAWFRDGRESYNQLAEETAWKMIRSRTDFVLDRNTWSGLNLPVRTVGSKDLQSTRSLSMVPHATIETFSILLEQYRQRQRQDLTDDLFAALRKAQVRANTGFLNELLLSDSRAQRPNWAWETYEHLTWRREVTPDIETFTILWHMMKKTADRRMADRLPHSLKFPDCRQLFANMMEFLPKTRLRLKIPVELYEEIILSFSISQDQVGTAVALRALRVRFNALPTPDTVKMVIYQLSRIGLEDEKGQAPRRLDKDSAATKERIASVTKILQKFKDVRIEALKERGIVFEQLNDIAKVEETELMLLDLLRYAAQMKLKRSRETQNVVEASRSAAEEMGVLDCVPWQPHGE